MKQTTVFAAICVGLVLFAACSKSDSGTGSSGSAVKDKLVAGKWQIIAQTATTNYMGKDTTIDVYSTSDACKKDNFEVYATDGTGTENEGADICPGKSETANFTWALLNSDTRLALVDSNPDTADVLEMTSTEMKLQLTSLNTSGVPIYYKYTFKNIK